MSTLTRKAIEDRLGRKDDTRLVITPMLSPKQIGDASVDVRLNNQFIVFRQHTLGYFAPQKPESGLLREMQERLIVRFGSGFVLHPGSLALGSTFEYVCLPSDVECQVEGRSSWARLGLQIATANSVEPGFKGVLTLELSNIGTIPIKLYPGVRIAQLVFRMADPPADNAYGGDRKYTCPVGPEFSSIQRDRDFKVFAVDPK